MTEEPPSVRLDALFRSAKYVEGVALAFEMIQQFGETSFYCFCLGRSFLYLNDRDSAVRWLSRAVEAEPVFPWAHYELGRLHDDAGATLPAAAHAESFLQARAAKPEGVQLNRVHQDKILGIAHACFATDRARAVDLYREIWSSGFPDYLTSLRLAEADLDAGRAAVALAALKEIQSAQPLDAWGLFCLARAYRAVGETDPAALAVSRAVEALPDSALVRITAAHRLSELGRLDEARRLLLQAETSPDVENHSAELAAARFRIAMFAGEHAELQRQASAAGGFAALPNWLLVEAVFTLTKPGDQITPADLETATLIMEHLEQDWPYTLPTVLALFLFYNRRRSWKQALALIERLRPEPVFDHPEVVLRILEIYCVTAQMAKAAELYIDKYAGRKLTQSEACIALRFLSEIRDWDEAGRVLLEFLDNQFVFPQGEFLILQICRRSNLHAAALSRLDAHGATIALPLRALRAAIADDVCISLGAAKVEPDGAGADRGQPAITLSKRNAMLLKPEPLSPEPVDATGIIGFLCSDRNYFLSAMTFLASYAANNPRRQATLRWAVFLDRSVPAAWGDLLCTFAVKLGIPVQVIREEEFVASDVIHLESYGIFTGGSTLSRAAYLRIYAAKYLFEKGAYHRAFYLDTDIICLTSLESFLDVSFEGCALLARPEEDIPEVADAAAQHGISQGCYFNSGVLVFNFEHRDMSDLLRSATKLAEEEQGRLIYHDQCALNISFHGNVHFLAPQYNHFLRPHRPDNGDYAYATFIHFLDKPKPWDVTFHREYRADWIAYATLTRLLVSADEYNALVRAANGGDLRPRIEPTLTSKPATEAILLAV